MESGAKMLTATDLAVVTSSKTDNYGALGGTKDNRLYKYVQYGGTVTSGNLVVAPGTVANHLNQSVQAAAAAGALSVFVTLGATAATQDQYAEGFLAIGVDGSGVPMTRKIRGNTATASSGVCQVFLDTTEPLLFALTTSNVVSLLPNLCNGVVASTSAGLPIGVVVNSATSGQFGWVQYYGECTVVNDAGGALSALGHIKQSTSVAGAIVTSTAATDVQVGVIVQAIAASKAGLVKLNLDD